MVNIMNNIKIKTADGTWKVVDKDWAFNTTCRMIKSWVESAMYTLEESVKYWNSQIDGLVITEDDYIGWLVNHAQD